MGVKDATTWDWDWDWGCKGDGKDDGKGKRRGFGRDGVGTIVCMVDKKGSSERVDWVGEGTIRRRMKGMKDGVEKGGRKGMMKGVINGKTNG
jgi:hypothetical protein